jgi:hypothetical protein
MCQFINRNNIYRSKVVAHTIIKSLIIFGNFMPLKKKQTPKWPPRMRIKVQQKISLTMTI